MKVLLPAFNGVACVFNKKQICNLWNAAEFLQFHIQLVSNVLIILTVGAIKFILIMQMFQMFFTLFFINEMESQKSDSDEHRFIIRAQRDHNAYDDDELIIAEFIIMHLYTAKSGRVGAREFSHIS